MDPDAVAYIAAVEAADGQTLETATKIAINQFVKGCKADPSPTPGVSNFQAIKASCILAGARTLAGALVPLKGTAPTNVGFTAPDYNRRTGLKGTGSAYLNSNRNRNSDPQNNSHICAYRTQPETTGARVLIGAGNTAGQAGATQIRLGTGSSYTRHTSDGADLFSADGLPAGFVGISRSNSTSYSRRLPGSTGLITNDTQLPVNAGFFIFTSSNLVGISDARISFYSIGEAVDLTALDARVTALMAALAVAIP
ncbi:hypothetical protein VZG28_05225 [Synechococcus elongatus IITB4]|uniref:hypothetical protein n=1 Tax=Synechococcus elongatus TaxID=32046 RepID=UPI0030CD69C7